MKKLFFFAFIFGLILAFGYSYWKTNKVSIAPTRKSIEKISSFSIGEAPKNSVKGTIESMSGVVRWESRIATAPSEIIKPVIISQGETLETDKDGEATITFKNLALVTLSSESKLSIIQTLPANFVFDQKNGSVSYEKLGETPIFIRALHMLTKINSGKLILSIDKETNEITINIKRGSAQIGFNDINNVSTVKDIREGEKLIYNDDAREVSIK
jgi:hypothetical protein